MLATRFLELITSWQLKFVIHCVKFWITCLEWVESPFYGGPKVSRQFQFAHSNFNLLTAVSICSQQFQFAHGSFNLLTAVSTCSRQFQFRSRQFQFANGNFNLLTAVSICSRQFQFHSQQFQFAHGNFNLLTAVSISLTAVSISLMMRLQWISANIGHAGCQFLWEILKYVAKLLITFVKQHYVVVYSNL